MKTPTRSPHILQLVRAAARNDGARAARLNLKRSSSARVAFDLRPDFLRGYDDQLRLSALCTPTSSRIPSP